MGNIDIAAVLSQACAGMPATTVMEVCGTHTHSIARSGLRRLLPPNLRLISGPGCPVCVTPESDIRTALYLSRRPKTIVASFGDMLRVPVPSRESGFDSLYNARGLGSDVRMAVSPMDVLRFARENPGKDVIWFAVGFETTAPHTAALILRAEAEHIRNLFVLCAHKTMPAALTALLSNSRRVDALLCPGHVAAVIGADAFRFVPEVLGIPAAVSGFEVLEIAAALLSLAELRRIGRADLRNVYPAAVRSEGNLAAQALIARVFEPCDAGWRGLGIIKNSGLAIQSCFSAFDAYKHFDLSEFSSKPNRPAEDPTNHGDVESACSCAAILRGELSPQDCPMFGSTCTPNRPFGPCMVSSEGACSAAYLYGTGSI